MTLPSWGQYNSTREYPGQQWMFDISLFWKKNLVFLTDYYFLNPYLIVYVLIKVKVGKYTLAKRGLTGVLLQNINGFCNIYKIIGA